MRASLHIGLAALLVLAPALCCCNVSWFGGRASAAVTSLPCPSCPESTPATPAPKAPVRHSCCHEEEPAPVVAIPVHATPAKHDAPGHAPRCQCCTDRPAAALPEPGPVIAAPEPTGELLPLALPGLAAVAPEHLGLLRGLDPPERAGVDALYEALFARHVLRC
jgi:hypothetical protein